MVGSLSDIWAMFLAMSRSSPVDPFPNQTQVPWVFVLITKQSLVFNDAAFKATWVPFVVNGVRPCTCSIKVSDTSTFSAASPIRYNRIHMYLRTEKYGIFPLTLTFFYHQMTKISLLGKWPFFREKWPKSEKALGLAPRGLELQLRQVGRQFPLFSMQLSPVHLDWNGYPIDIKNI